MKKQETIFITVTYPWTGTYIDDAIVGILGVESKSSGCGFGERDLQFALPKCKDTNDKIETLKKLTGVSVHNYD